MRLIALLAADTLDAEQVRGVLRYDSFALGFGLIFLALGAAAAAVFLFRRRSQDPAVLWFGIFSALYGFRLAMHTRTARFTVDAGRAAWPFIIAAITYSIAIPAILFLREVIPGWRRVLTRLLWV